MSKPSRDREASYRGFGVGGVIGERAFFIQKITFRYHRVRKVQDDQETMKTTIAKLTSSSKNPTQPIPAGGDFVTKAVSWPVPSFTQQGLVTGKPQGGVGKQGSLII
jgi:hypothetical protein